MRLINSFLDGTVLETATLEDKEKFLFHQLLKSRMNGENHALYNDNPKELLAAISKLGPRQVCQYQFKTNDIVWICRECQKDETCVLCNNCYQNSCHEGHDVYFYHSAVGGCCDCGDPDAWAVSGFCVHHGQRVDNPIEFIPEDIRQAAIVLFEEMAAKIAQHARGAGSAPAEDPEAVTYTLMVYFDEFHSIEDFLNGFAADMLRLYNITVQFTNSFLTEGSWAVQRVPAEEFSALQSILNFFSSETRQYHMAILSDRDIHREEAVVVVVNWLHSVAQTNDGFCELICNAFPIHLLTTIMSNSMRLSRRVVKALHNLLITLMASQSFKMVVAVAYTRAYRSLSLQFGRGYGVSGHSMFNIAVQFLNRDWVVNELVFVHSFFEEVAGSLSDMLRGCVVDGADLSSNPVLSKRRYNPIIGDLKVVFSSVEGSARVFLSGNLDSLLDIYAQFQLLHRQTRALLVHVDFEDRLWMDIFNLILGSTSLFDYVFSWFADQSAAQTSEMVYHCVSSADNASHQLINEQVCTQLREMELVRLKDSAELLADSVSPQSEGRSSRHASGFWGKIKRLWTGSHHETLSSAGAPSSNNNDTSNSSGGAMSLVPVTSRASSLISAGSAMERIFWRCVEWQQRYFSALPTELVPLLSMASGAEALLPPLYLHVLPVERSFHLPLHRFLAKAVAEACKVEHLSVAVMTFRELLRNNAKEVPHTVDLTLSTMVFAAQVKQGMWRRNGLNMMDQLLNYGEVPFCRIYKDLDLLTLQCCLTAYSAHHFVNQLLFRFEVSAFLSTHGLSEGQASPADDRQYRIPLLDEALKLLVTIVTELPGVPSSGSISERLLPQMRRELVHCLVCVTSSTTYSQLRECIAHIPESSKVSSDQVDGLILELADKHIGSGLLAPTYTLKKELWSEYDPCFPRLSESLHQSAIEHRPKLSGNAPTVKAPLSCHPCFANIRPDLLFDHTLLGVLRDVLLVTAAARTKLATYEFVRTEWAMKSSESLFSTTAQLLTLALHVLGDESTPNATRLALSFSAFALQEVVPSSPCCLLGALADLHANLTSTATIEVNTKFWLGWILDFIAGINAECAAFIAKCQSSSQFSDSQDKQSAMMQRRNQTRDQALSDMQANAAKFLAMMGDVSDSEDEDDQDAQRPPSSHLSGEVVDATDLGAAGAETEHVRAMSLDTDPASDSAPAMDEHGQEVVLCIICQAGHDPLDTFNGLAYLALSHSSSVHVQRDQEIHLPPPETLIKLASPDTTPLHRPGSCDMHIAFCGHAMHFTCFNAYFESSQRRAAEQRGLILDHTKRQFHCPLCKKLNNLLVPHVPDIAKKSAESHSGALRGAAGDWLSWTLRPCLWGEPRRDNYQSMDDGEGSDAGLGADAAHDENEEHGMDVNDNDASSSSGEERGASSSAKRSRRSDSQSGQVLVDAQAEDGMRRSASSIQTDAINTLLQSLIRSSQFQVLGREIVSQGSTIDSVFAKTLLRSFWFRFLQDFHGTVFTEDRSVLDPVESGESKEAQLRHSFMAVLQSALSSVAFSLCCSYFRPTNGTGSNNHEPDNRKADSSSSSTPSSAYKAGFDSLKFVDQTVAALGTALAHNEYLQSVHAALMASLRGEAGVRHSLQESGWIFSGPAEVSIAPILKAQLVDVLVLSVAICRGRAAVNENQFPSDAESVESHVANLNHCVRWLCVAKLLQLVSAALNSSQQLNTECSSSHRDVTSEWRSVGELVQRMWLLVESKSAGALSTTTERACLDGAQMRSLLWEWVVFLRATNFILHKMCADLTVLPSPSEHCHDSCGSASDLSDDVVLAELAAMQLLDLTGGGSGASLDCLLGTCGKWLSDAAGSEAVAFMGGDGGLQAQHVIVGVEVEASSASGGVVAGQESSSPTNNNGKPPVVQLPVRRAQYPFLRSPRLLALPEDYSKLHAHISSLCSYDLPVLCLVCGAVLDAQGKGQCSAHSVQCGGETCVFFQIQDCVVMLAHGPRFALMPAPYVDMYGENQHSFRGKPLRLDRKRYEQLRKLWSEHEIAREVVAKRSNSTTVVVNGYY